MDNYELMGDEQFSLFELESNQVQVDLKDHVVIMFPYSRYELIPYDNALSYQSIFNTIKAQQLMNCQKYDTKTKKLSVNHFNIDLTLKYEGVNIESTDLHSLIPRG